MRDFVVDEFALLARDRWIAGRAERGLTADDPFHGDPAYEFNEKILGASNYLDVMYSSGIIDEDVARKSQDMLRDLFRMANTSMDAG